MQDRNSVKFEVLSVPCCPLCLGRVAIAHQGPDVLDDVLDNVWSNFGHLDDLLQLIHDTFISCTGRRAAKCSASIFYGVPDVVQAAEDAVVYALDPQDKLPELQDHPDAFLAPALRKLELAHERKKRDEVITAACFDL